MTFGGKPAPVSVSADMKYWSIRIRATARSFEDADSFFTYDSFIRGAHNPSRRPPRMHEKERISSHALVGSPTTG
jgi:hypothetical protein